MALYEDITTPTNKSKYKNPYYLTPNSSQYKAPLSIDYNYSYQSKSNHQIL